MENVKESKRNLLKISKKNKRNCKPNNINNILSSDQIAAFVKKCHKHKNSQVAQKQNIVPNLFKATQKSISILTPYEKKHISNDRISFCNPLDMILQNVLKPRIDKNSSVGQLKCFMTARHAHDSYIIEERVVTMAIKKIKQNPRFKKDYKFSYNPIIAFGENVIKRNGNSQALLKSFQFCYDRSFDYPPTVSLMLAYFGCFMFSLNSRYDKSNFYCQRLFDQIVNCRAEQYLIIVLLMKTKLSSNLSEWNQCLQYLTKLLYFAWRFNLGNLQNWCYFEISRAYFFLGDKKQAEIFKLKSQNSDLEPKKSIYRQVSIEELGYQINKIWQGDLDFKYKSIINSHHLVIPKGQAYDIDDYIQDKKILKSSIKNIVKQCEIRHVPNILSRMSQISYVQLEKHTRYSGSMPKLQTQPSENLMSNKSGNNFLLTHKSFNKNMNMFFRSRKNSDGKPQSKQTFFTIENSQKNWCTLKQMLRNILAQMNQYSPMNSLQASLFISSQATLWIV